MSTKPVLCAVDISNQNRDVEVLKKAARLASMDNAKLDVITVLPDFGMSVVGSFFEGDYHDKAVEEAQRRLNDLVKTTLGADANENIRHIVSTGNAYEEILKAANLAGTGLIVIGAHKPDFKDYLLGPNASRVVRHSDCSVYVVR
ncbi:Universal stress protein F [Roseovarius litorisediminis]|uniref:Universal stress protein F n=1 Tax=Roseovarius litorisediminis TaxID=1312363 RepID=A0A1Y5SNJ3_9RHOB|nr:universal stress protein [Roseovarius litorisediminis]SLN44804.1 Universal stress protein F [Roseovarius litorisediminis]